MGFWPVVLNVLKNSDVILLLVDARMPELTRSDEIIARVDNMHNKRLFFVFNKIDLVSAKILKELKAGYPNAFFVSGKKKTGTKELKRALDNMADNWNRDSLRVGLVGYPNVGKSSIINLLSPGAHLKVKGVAGTTKGVSWIRSGRLRIQDSPGVIPYYDGAAKVGITAAKDPHKLKNPEKVAFKVIEYLNRKGGESLAKFYGVEQGLDEYELFEAIGRKKGYLIKGGEVDEHRTSITIIDDWQQGRIRLK